MLRFSIGESSQQSTKQYNNIPPLLSNNLTLLASVLKPLQVINAKGHDILIQYNNLCIAFYSLNNQLNKIVDEKGHNQNCIDYILKQMTLITQGNPNIDSKELFERNPESNPMEEHQKLLLDYKEKRNKLINSEKKIIENKNQILIEIKQIKNYLQQVYDFSLNLRKVIKQQENREITTTNNSNNPLVGKKRKQEKDQLYENLELIPSYSKTKELFNVNYK
ncbi:hypothetical protein Mgra_00003764, partial [Meloidogyne graminicola]